jgi:hypothetical protein
MIAISKNCKMYMLDHSKKLFLEADLTPEEADMPPCLFM